MTNVGEMFVRLSADPKGVKQGTDEGVRHLQRFETATKRMSTTLGTSSTAASAGMNAMRGSMTSLAASALQTAPGVAQLGSVIGNLAFGSAITVGVLAGLAAIAFAWEKLTEETRAAEKATEDAITALDKLGPQGTEASAILAQVQVARAQLRQIELVGAKIGALQAEQNRPGSMVTDVARAETATLLAQNQAAANAMRNRIQQGEEEINRIHAAGWAKLEAERLEQVKAGAKLQEDARLKAARETLEKLERLEQEFASKRDTFRTPLGEMRLPAPVAPLGAMVALGGVSVANAGAGGGPGPSLASQALDQVAQSAMGLVTSFSPLGLLSTALSSAFEVMQPAIDALLLPIRAFGQLLGRIVGGALSYFAEGLGYIIKAIGWLIDKINIFGGDGGIGKVGQEMIDAAKAARRAADGSDALADAANRAADSVTNMPEIFDLALRRRQAAMGGVPVSGGSTGGGAGGGGTSFHFYNPPANLDTDKIVRDVTRGIREAKRRGGVSELDLLLSA